MTEKPEDTTGAEKEQSNCRDESPLEQLLYLALGTALAAKKRIESDSTQFREFQQQAQDNARTLLKGLSSRGEEGRNTARDTARDALRTLLREVIDDLGLATKKDLEQLKQDLER